MHIDGFALFAFCFAVAGVGYALYYALLTIGSAFINLGRRRR